MSYILDALKRADAERARGHVPGLHTPNMPPGSVSYGHKGWPVTAWVSAVVAAAIAVAFTTWWMQSDTQAPAPSTASATDVRATAQPTPAGSAAASASPEPVARPPVSDAPPEAVLPLLTPPAPAPPTTPPRPGPQPPTAQAAGTKPRAGAAANSTASGENPGIAPAPVRSFAELSPEARAALPAVQVNGSTYSQNPAHRMLIANGKVVQEGQEIVPGLMLETIGPRSAVLNHRGMRYSIGY